MGAAHADHPRRVLPERPRLALTGVERSGDVALRPARPWSGAVLALLRHLEAVGYGGAPRVVGDGFAPDGREAVSWVPGDDAPACWSEEAAYDVGVLLRGLHAATASFVVPEGAVWQPWWVRDLPGSAPVVGHADAAPWNVVARAGRPVALVDWESAGPVAPEWEVAQAAWLNARLHDDDVAERDGLPPAADRARLVAAIADGYGLSRADRAALAGRMLDFAVLSARQDALEGLARGVEWRARSAAWIVRHRAVLAAALA